MNEINDDLLNKYIDGELNKELMQQIRAKLESSRHDMTKYKILLSVHEKLKNLPVEKVSPDFSRNIMVKLQKSLKSKKEQNIFIVSVLSLFFFIALGIISYLLTNYLFTAEPDSSGAFLQFTEHAEDLISLLKSFFSKGNISIVGSIFSFILLISGYFFFNSFKHSKPH